MKLRTAKRLRLLTFYLAATLSLFCWWTSPPPAGLAATLSSAAWFAFWAFSALVVACMISSVRAVLARVTAGTIKIASLPALLSDQARVTLTFPKGEAESALRLLLDDPVQTPEDVHLHIHT